MTAKKDSADKSKPKRKKNASKEKDQSGPSPVRDEYSLSGEVRRGGVVVQGPGARVEVHQVYRDLSSVEEERQRQIAELKQLKQAVGQIHADLQGLVNSPPPSRNNPYHFIEPFSEPEHSLFTGRKDILRELVDRAGASHSIFLGGSGGIGKTSLLKAGLVPALLEQGHLPLLVPVTSEALETGIKKRLLPNLEALPFIQAMSLPEFVRRVSDELKHDRELFLIIDRLEEFFEQPEELQQQFKLDWVQCVSGIAPEAHWIFCIHLGSAYFLANFFQPEVQPFAHMIVLPPLTSEAARNAILKPAETAGIQIEPAVLEGLLQQLGGSSVDPTHLQIVCFSLAGGPGSLVKRWDADHFDRNGEVEGILRAYLDRVIQQLPPTDREPAWQVLSALSDHPAGPVEQVWLLKRLALYRIPEGDTARVLDSLAINHLIETEDGKLRLSSPELRPRIQLWKEQRSSAVKAREEARMQLRQILGSAVRGLFGGAAGLALLDRLVYPQLYPDVLYDLYFLSLVAFNGAVAGFFLILSVDIAIASFHGPSRWLRYFIGGLGGAASFSLALFMYGNTLGTGDTALAMMMSGAGTGLLWGGVSGILTVAVMELDWPVWISIPAAAILSGLALGFFSQLSGFFSTVPSMMVSLGGLAMLLTILVLAIFGRRASLEGGKR